MKVLIIVGSGTQESRSLHLGQAIAKALEARGAEVELIDLLTHALPAYNVTTEKTDTYDDKTRAFLNTTKQSDAFVWVTPVYHGSYSSVLKNALDWQHFFLDKKVIGFASNGSHRSPVAVDQLMMVARAQHGVILPTRVCTDNPDYDDNKQLHDPDILQRVENFSDEMVDFTRRFSNN